MHLHKFDTSTKNAALHAWRGQPSTPEEWLEHWNKEGGIWIPCADGNRPVFLKITHISPVIHPTNQQADYLIEAKNSKPFYIRFARHERAFRPLGRPTLIIPHGSLKQAWWLLSAH